MIKSKDQLINAINSDLLDNSTGEISPKDVRQNLLDIVDSVHNLLNDRYINSLNLGTPNATSVRFGEHSLSKYNLSDYLTSGNTAVGYASMHNNYQGVRNTAIGGYSLTCNVYGVDNVGLGYNSLAGNTTGHANIGIGSYSLNDNKIGDLNIAIGHGAGYYADRNTNKKLFIGSHPVDGQHICDNPDGIGWTPLVYGDLENSNLRFGIATRSLHSYGTLQVSGSITPTISGEFGIGHPFYPWNSVHTSELNTSGIVFDPSTSFRNSSSGILVSGNIVPESDSIFNLGHQDRYWNRVYINELYANSSVIVEENNYENKVLYLASSGSDPFVGYLSEDDLLDAGLVIRASGFPDPYLLFYSDTNSCDKVFRRWRTNIGIEIESGEALRARSFVSPEYCDGLHLTSGQLFHSSDSIFNDRNSIAGIGNVNFIADSGTAVTEYSVNYVAQNSGVDIAQRFLSRSINKSQQNNQDIISGFSLKYFDEYGSSISSESNIDRFCISSYDNDIYPNNNVILMKNNEASGVFGINNFSDADGTLAIPNTIFNVRSIDSATARITSEAEGDVYTSIQLLTRVNCLQDGFELQFVDSGNVTNFNVYEASGMTTFMRFNPSGTSEYIGILSSGEENEMLTLGCSGYPSAVLSMYEVTSSPIATSGYGKLYFKYNQVDSPSQTLIPTFMDDAGNEFDLITDPCDFTKDAIFSDDISLVLGRYSVQDRCESVGNSNNIVFGHSSLPIISGSVGNVVVGNFIGNTLVSGDNNVVIGTNSIVGCSGGISNNIIIGNNLGSDLSTSNTLLIGNQDPLISGSFIDNSLHIVNGTLYVDNNTSSKYLKLNNNTIDLYDSSDISYPSDSLSFSFSANESSELLLLNHNADPLDIEASYSSPIASRPYAEVKGDIRLLGALRFSDGSEIESNSGVINASGVASFASGIAIENQERINSLVFEGFSNSIIDFPASYSSPTSGIITNPASQETFVVINRDQNLRILANDFVIGVKIQGEYRPLWISNASMNDSCCIK